ncbi:hypothetical protein U1Q18_013144 [Sarracenia purpurea var. burkii]
MSSLPAVQYESGGVNVTSEMGSVVRWATLSDVHAMGDATCRDRWHRGGAGNDAQGRRWGGAWHWAHSGAVATRSGGDLWCCKGSAVAAPY